MTDAADLWFSQHAADWSANTRAAYAQQLRVHIQPALGARLIGQVRHMDTQALYSALAARGLRRESIRQAKGIIDGLFSWLRKQDVDVHDVRADLPRRAPARRETAVLSYQQIAAVMADPSWVGTVSRVMLLCGLRPGEALALRHCDIESGWLVVSRAAKKHGLGDTKTHRARRVPVPPALEAELKERAGSAEDLLFPRPENRKGRASDRLLSVNHVYVTIRERFGIVPRQFRATFATLVDRDPVNVAAMLGHSGPRMTTKHYMKPLAEESARAVAELERRLRRAG